MKAYGPWQVLVTLIGMLFFGYGILSIAAIIVAWLNWPYLNAAIVVAMLLIYIVSIPATLNYTRRSYKWLFGWFVLHILFSNAIYAWHYAKAGIISSSGQVTHSFRDAFYFSVTT